MQKKNHNPSETSSNWQNELKKQERADMLKKIMMWGAILGVSILGLAGLVLIADKSTSTTETPIENANLPKMTENDIVVGERNAKVTITEYADFQCPACASYNPTLNRIVEENPDVKVIYRFFPLRGIHKNALISGQAGYAAHKLGNFSEMKDLLYANQADWENLGDPKEIFEGYASSIGLDVEEFRTIMNSEEAKKAVEDGEKEAIGLGLNSTPSFFIGNKQFSASTYDEFKKLIDEELKNSGAKPTVKPLQ
ncbi:MAG: DsbA family protein [Candidatus Levybacteria bacterium]|nr:DsbA family protein [Candidatus Levybacteria bacterium]